MRSLRLHLGARANTVSVVPVTPNQAHLAELYFLRPSANLRRKDVWLTRRIVARRYNVEVTYEDRWCTVKHRRIVLTVRNPLTYK